MGWGNQIGIGPVLMVNGRESESFKELSYQPHLSIGFITNFILQTAMHSALHSSFNPPSFLPSFQNSSLPNYLPTNVLSFSDIIGEIDDCNVFKHHNILSIDNFHQLNGTHTS